MKQYHLLVVDDERGSRESLHATFCTEYRVSLAASCDEALAVLASDAVDVIFLDVVMPGKDGIATLREVQVAHPDVPVIMCSAHSTIRPVVEAIRVGAYDFVTKPFDLQEIRLTTRRAIGERNLKRKLEILQNEVSREYPIDGIVGDSPAFRRALNEVQQAARSDATVMISGESGTGKELVARLMHALSDRKNEPFVAVHCAALSETLMESELFGHEKGAFTSADKRKPGRFDLAGSGTLFFDEVGEMTLSTQVKLLRVIQEREFMRVGGTQVIRTNARIIGASAKDLRTAVAAGEFRDDLYYRLSVVPLHLPPLRERIGDIPTLALHFLNYFKERMSLSVKGFSLDAIELLQAYAWPGNIRELRNIVERMAVLHGRSNEIKATHLPEEFHVNGSATPNGMSAQPAATPIPPPPPGEDVPLEEAVNAFEKQLVWRALNKANGNQTRAAEYLATTRRILKYRMEKLNIRYSANGHGQAVQPDQVSST